MTTLFEAIVAHGITVSTEFVPFSQSRNKASKDRSLNWRVTLHKDGRAILTTDYQAGIAHCPAYKQARYGLIGIMTLLRERAIILETEHGKSTHPRFSSDEPELRRNSVMLNPNTCDVVYALVSDADVLNSGGFEDWASELGYDPDSRSAEGVYKACLEIALKLRNGLGEATLAALAEAAREY